MRKDPLITEELYHVFNRSIAQYVVFNNKREFLRMLKTIQYYQWERPGVSLSQLLRPAMKDKNSFDSYFYLRNKKKQVGIIAYCLMPTHFHMIVKQLKDNGISIFMNNLQNSYTRYFNIKHKRKGPLWEARFKSVLVEGDEQLLHLTRYIHLNPVTARLVNKPESWSMSSYKEYVQETNEKICSYKDVIEIEPKSYKKFVKGRISYQRELEEMKDLLLE